MNDRNKAVGGWSALGLGVVGGILLGWAWYRRSSRNMRAITPDHPMEFQPRRTGAEFGLERHAQGRVTASTAETTWPEAAASSLSSRSPQPRTAPSQDEEPAVGVTASIAETTWPEERTELSQPGVADQSAAAPVAETQEAPTPEDLTPIEGIGPKINQVLHEAGINTFVQLAEADVSRLQQILSEANIHLANADTWPEQARLAAAGKWEELRDLQGQLDAGVRRPR